MSKNKKIGVFSPPKYRKGDQTSKGVIEGINYRGGANWYWIDGLWYAEVEL